jgi:hypothetical protein
MTRVVGGGGSGEWGWWLVVLALLFKWKVGEIETGF